MELCVILDDMSTEVSEHRSSVKNAEAQCPPLWFLLDFIYKQVCAHNIFQLREACPGSSWEMKEQSQGAEAKVEKRPFSERLKRSLMK